MLPQPRSTRVPGRIHPQACSPHQACSNRRTARARTQAPELFAFPPVVSAAADVYAFAMLAWVVCTREQPYRNLQSPETVMKEMLMQATPTPPLILSALPAPTPTRCHGLCPFFNPTPSPRPPPRNYFYS